MGPRCLKLEEFTRRSPLRQKAPDGRLYGQALHLIGGVPGAEQATLAAEELHGLEEARADGAACNGEAQGVYQVASALLLFGGKTTHRFLDRGLCPLGKSC